MSILVFCLASFFLAITSSLALQGVVSCPPGCRLLPSRVSSLALQGALQEGFCYGAVLFDVAKPGELASFHCCQQGLLLPSKGVYLLSHIFICLVFSVRNAGESPEACFVSNACKRIHVSVVIVQLSHP